MNSNIQFVKLVQADLPQDLEKEINKYICIYSDHYECINVKYFNLENSDEDSGAYLFFNLRK